MEFSFEYCYYDHYICNHFYNFYHTTTFSRFTESFKNEVTSSRIDTTKLLVNAVQKSEAKPESFIGISAIGGLLVGY